MNEPFVEITISSLAFGGDGIGTLPDGKVCFVPGTAPGDRVQIVLTTEKKRFARGRLTRVLDASPDRVVPACPYALAPDHTTGACPGCAYAHLTYSAELDWKNRQFEGFLTRGGLASHECLLPPVASPVETGYRNKLTLTWENGRAGYRGDDNRSLVPINACLLAHPEINAKLVSVRTAGLPNGMRKLRFRWTSTDGAVCDSSSGGAPLTEQLGEYGVFTIPRHSFFQVNTAVACELIARVLTTLNTLAPRRLIELYSGSGIFSILASERFPELRTAAVELDPDAVEAAKNNARTHGVAKQCRFIRGDAASEFAPLTRLFPGAGTVVLLDPPRTGLDPAVTAELLRFGADHILYISCAPDTLRRDLERLNGSYRVRRSLMLDMFPRTAHFETLTLLERR